MFNRWAALLDIISKTDERFTNGPNSNQAQWAKSYIVWYYDLSCHVIGMIHNELIKLYGCPSSNKNLKHTSMASLPVQFTRNQISSPFFSVNLRREPRSLVTVHCSGKCHLFSLCFNWFFKISLLLLLGCTVLRNF